jgi:4-hydroxy-tetrahydrodipicolinate reductase
MRLVLVGAGPVGVAAARAALDDGIAARVGFVVDPDAAARSAAAADLGGEGMAASTDLAPALPGDAAVVAFSSRAGPTAAVVSGLVSSGYDVVTTCEELADPPAPLRDRIEVAVRSSGRTVVATGANPGFVMDRLALTAAEASRSVRAVRVWRVVDTGTRRGPLVDKTGYGLSPDAFAAGVAAGRLGHVGMAESARLVAAGLGWPANVPTAEIEPALRGDTVAGLHQVVRLDAGEGRFVELDLIMEWNAADPHDRILVDGDPPIDLRIAGGYHGDAGTTAAVCRALALLARLDSGFYRPTDLPLGAPS